MAEDKRFKLTEYYFWDSGRPLSNSDVLDLLNGFNEQHVLMKEIISEKGTELDFLKDENLDFRKKWEYHERMHEKFKDEALYLQNRLDDLLCVEKENEQLRKDLIDHSALIKMLEDCKALSIEDIIWNSRGFKSEEQFNDVFKGYLEDAKKRWKR